MKNESKIIFGGLIIILIIISTGFLFSFLLSEEIKNISIKRSETINSAFITSFATNQLVANDFELGSSDERKNTFEKFFQEMKTEEMLRIKVWNKDGTIVYSNDESIVGKNFSGNERFQHAIAGMKTTEIKDPVDPENISEVGYGQLMEIYIPIYLDSIESVGVIELYYNMDMVNESISQINLIIIISIITMSTIIGITIIVFSIVTTRSSKKAIQQEKFSSIGELSSRLAHDIRNPLTVIKATIDLMENDSEKNEKNNLRFASISESVERITHQVENVLDFVREKPITLEFHHVSEILKNTLSRIPNLDPTKISLPKNDAKILCDLHMIEVVFVNLIMNSLQATKNKGDIKISLKELDDVVQIEVEDTGEGIPKDVLSKIFEPLFTTKQEGTGLGLASCKKIIEQHSGTIFVKNNPTTFTITLPKS